jgi:hypothetical protein
MGCKCRETRTALVQSLRSGDITIAAKIAARGAKLMAEHAAKAAKPSILKSTWRRAR